MLHSVNKPNKEEIKSLISNYSLNDLLTSLFISDIWLPNISTPIQHLYLVSVVTSQAGGFFKKKDKIESYEDFEELLNKLYKLVQPFPELEDYIPEADWGEIKYHIRNEDYKFLYGGEFATSYDYLQQHEIIFSPFCSKFVSKINRNPIDELISLLQIQDFLISEVKQPYVKDIQLQYKEIPPREFWNNAKNFYSNFNAKKYFSESSLNAFTMKLGGISEALLDGENEFIDLAFDGNILPSLFLYHDDRYYLLLPRRSIGVFRDNWGKQFFQNIDYSEEDIVGKISMELHHYLSERIKFNESENIPFVSAVEKNRKPHTTIFQLCIMSENKIILFHILPPIENEEIFEELLKRKEQELKEAIKLINIKPQTLGDHLNRRDICFSTENNEALLPYIITVVPSISPDLSYFEYPKTFPGHVISLVDFLGVFDEIDNTEKFSPIIDYIDDNILSASSPFISFMDKYATFVDLNGLIIPGAGAKSPKFAMIDPNWGSNFRYESLKMFWKDYGDIKFYGNPRRWRIDASSEFMKVLIGKSEKQLVYTSQIGKCITYSTFPFEELSYEPSIVSNLMCEIIQGDIQYYGDLLSKHPLFRNYLSIHALIFPKSLVEKEEKFKHVKHLLPLEGDLWKMDSGIFDEGRKKLGLRIVFNDDKALDYFSEKENRESETSFFWEVICKLDEIVSSNDVIQELKTIIDDDKMKKVRYQLMSYSREASFPDFTSYLEPGPNHYKWGRKKVAEIGAKTGIKSGEFKLKDAKYNIDLLIKGCVTELDMEISHYKRDSAIKILVSNINSQSYENGFKRREYESAAKADIDYDLLQKSSDEERKYIDLNKDYRYLIEKFVQLDPNGEELLTSEKVKKLLAFVDWIQVLYSASDCLHYDIGVVGLTISHDYIPEVNYEEDSETKQNEFGKYLQKRKLQTEEVNQVESNMSEDLLNEIDQSFLTDLGFRFSVLIATLKILTFWTEYNKEEVEKTYYEASTDTIVEILKENINDITDLSELYKVLEFVTLSAEKITLSNTFNDLPVSEHKKRFYRFTLKPLIKNGGNLLWGPYSTRQCSAIWTNTIRDGYLPVQLMIQNSEKLDTSKYEDLASFSAKNIQKTIDKIKNQIELDIEIRSKEILGNFTKFVIPNLFLHKTFPQNGYIDIGDYDVFAYLESIDTLIIIDGNDVVPAFCMKDGAELRRKIFGNESKLSKMTKREEYLKANIKKIAKDLKWPFNEKTKIQSIYVSRHQYWWTYFPPVETNVKFLTVDMLDDFIINKLQLKA